jgi:tetratricopeptide (TPR) repeat protein
MRLARTRLVLGCAASLLALSPSLAAQATKAPPLPPDRETTLKRAGEALQAGRRAEAVRLLRSAADRFQSVRALLQLARLQAEGKDEAAAFASLERARALAPSSEDVLSAHAELSVAAHRPLAAIHDLEALTRMCPTVAQYQHRLGTALLEVGDAAGAAGWLREAPRPDPAPAATLLALGRALNEQKLYAEARAHLLRSLEREPESAAAAAALAESQVGLGELGEAEVQAQRALARSGDDATANLVLGLVRMKQGRDDEARAALLKAAAAEPASPTPHGSLSLLYARLGDAASARKHREMHERLAQQMEERVNRMRTETGLAPVPHGGERP